MNDPIYIPLVEISLRSSFPIAPNGAVFDFLKQEVADEIDGMEKIIMSLLYIHYQGSSTKKALFSFMEEIGAEGEQEEILEYLLSNRLIVETELCESQEEVEEALEWEEGEIEESLHYIEKNLLRG